MNAKKSRKAKAAFLAWVLLADILDILKTKG